MNKLENTQIILASSSPRRIEMMRAHGIDPKIIKPECSEILPENIGMEEAVMFLALKKALWVEEKILSDPHLLSESLKEVSPYIVAADTIVYYDHIIGKPENKKDAFNILTTLRNKAHYVATGVSIVKAGEPIRRVFCEVTKVFFNDYSDEELLDYLDTDEPYDKAGAYAIQGTFSKYIDHIEGDMNNVIGFPWDRILREYNAMKKSELNMSRHQVREE